MSLVILLASTASPAGELLSRSLPQTERHTSQASSRLAELLKCIPLCILQYPPFFLPLPKQQASRHLGYFKNSPPSLKVPPPLHPTNLLSLSLSLSQHTHKHTGYFKRKWIHVVVFFFLSQVFTKVFKDSNEAVDRALPVVSG